MNVYFARLIRCTTASSAKTAIASLERLNQNFSDAPNVAHADDEEPHTIVLYNLLTVARSLLHLFVPESCDYESDFIIVCNAKPEGGPADRNLATIVPLWKQTDFWRCELAECKQKVATHTEAMAKVTELEQIIGEHPELGMSLWRSLRPRIPSVPTWRRVSRRARGLNGLQLATVGAS